MPPVAAPEKLHVERLGTSGYPLLLLHGWGRSLENLKPLGHLLASQSQVHLIDLPGFGKSMPPDGVWDAYRYADYLVEYLDAQGVERVDIAGHSFGGKVALCFAIRHPDRIRKLVLMGASGLKRSRTLSQKGRMLAIRWMGKGIKTVDAVCGTKLFTERFATKYGSSDYKNAGAMRGILVKSVNEDLSAVVKSISAQTLILWGNEDTETPPELAKRLCNSIQGSRLALFPGKGHYIFDDTGAHLCAYYILPFLSDPIYGGFNRV